MQKYSLIPAFTLVELIVVIVILAILSTISFLSFNSYSSSSRDSIRLSDITSIAKGLTLQYSIGGSYIIPDNSVSLLSGSTTIIGYQGKAGYNTLNSIKLSTSNNNSGKDPLDNTYYTYNINSNKNKYQLSGFLENKGNIINRTSSINNTVENEKGKIENTIAENGKYKIENNGISDLIPHLTPAYRQAGPSNLGEKQEDFVIARNEAIYNNIDLSNFNLINQTYSTNYTNRYPYTKGDSIGVILNYTGTTTGNNTNNTIYTPIEDNISTSTGIDISSGTLTSGKIVINNNTDSSTGVSVVSMSGYVSIVSTSVNNIQVPTCGSNNRKDLSSSPTTNLCSIGTASSVTYNSSEGKYSWTCGGTANCNAFNNSFTVLSIHGDGVNNSTSFTDSESMPKSITTFGNTKISTTQSVFGGSSIYFDGNGDYLTLPDHTDWDYGVGNFTIDMWIYPEDTTMYQAFFGQRSGAGNDTTNTTVDIYDGKINFAAYVGNPYYGSRGSGVISQNTWTHIAFVRNGTIVTFYINGIAQSSGSISGNIGGGTINNPSSNFIIGADGYWYPSNQYLYKGYIDEIHVSKGIAKWTTNFNPPTASY